jgi:hypothetical protein
MTLSKTIISLILVLMVTGTIYNYPKTKIIKNETYLKPIVSQEIADSINLLRPDCDSVACQGGYFKAIAAIRRVLNMTGPKFFQGPVMKVNIYEPNRVCFLESKFGGIDVNMSLYSFEWYNQSQSLQRFVIPSMIDNITVREMIFNNTKSFNMKNLSGIVKLWPRK